MTDISSQIREPGANLVSEHFQELKKFQTLVRQKEERIRELHGQIHSLHQALKNSQRQKTLIVATMENRVDKKIEEGINLQIQLKSQIQSSAQNNEKTVREHEQMTKKNQQSYQKNLQELEDEKTRLSNEIKDLVHFKAQKSEILSETQFYKMQYDKLKKKNQDMKISYQKKLAQMKQQFSALESQVGDRIKRESNTKARNMISDIEKNIEDQNDLLANQLEQQKQMIERLRQEKQFYQKQWRQNQRDKELISGTVNGYKSAHSDQQKKIKLLSGRIQLLQKSLASIVKDFEKEKELIKYKHEQTLKQQKQQIHNLEQQFLVKTKQLKSVKALAQMILDQRSDVEQFFLQALEQIKQEVRRKLADQKKAAKSRLPGISDHKQIGGSMTTDGLHGTSQQQPGKNYSDKVDLNDLDWEDRERVLRLLFSKMNAGVPASNWRAFARPMHGDDDLPTSKRARNQESQSYENMEQGQDEGDDYYQDDRMDIQQQQQIQALQHWTAAGGGAQNQ